VTAAAFAQRRKMLRASLRGIAADTQAVLGEARIDPTARAEQLDIVDFARLAIVVERRNRQSREPGP